MEYALECGGRTVRFDHVAPVAHNDYLEHALHQLDVPLTAGTSLWAGFHRLVLEPDGDDLRLAMPTRSAPWRDLDVHDLTYAVVTHEIATLMAGFWQVDRRTSRADDPVWVEPGIVAGMSLHVWRIDTGWVVHAGSPGDLDAWPTCTAGELLAILPEFAELLYVPVGTRGVYRDDVLVEVSGPDGQLIGGRDRVTGQPISAEWERVRFQVVALAWSLDSLRESLDAGHDAIAALAEAVVGPERLMARTVEYAGEPAPEPEVPVLPGDLASQVVHVDPDALQASHRRVEVVHGDWHLRSLQNDPSKIAWRQLSLPEVVAQIPSLLELTEQGPFKYAEVCFYGSLAVVDTDGSVVRGHRGIVESSIHQPPGPSERDDIELSVGGRPVRVRFGPQVRGSIDSLAAELERFSPAEVYDGAFVDVNWNRFVFRDDDGDLRLHTPAYADLTPLNSTLDDITYGMVVDQLARRGAALLIEHFAGIGALTASVMPAVTHCFDVVTATDDKFGFDSATASRTAEGWRIDPDDPRDRTASRELLSAQLCGVRKAAAYAMLLPPGSWAGFSYDHLTALGAHGETVPLPPELLRELNDPSAVS